MNIHVLAADSDADFYFYTPVGTIVPASVSSIVSIGGMWLD